MTIDATSATEWLRGDAAVRHILPLADRFRALLLADASAELGESFPAYLPWMAVRSRRRELHPLFSLHPPVPSPALLTDVGTLKVLRDALATPNGHPLEAIVPHDIQAQIDVDFGQHSREHRRSFDQAKKILAIECPWIYELLTRMISYVVPIIHRPHGSPVKRGFSTPLCYGAIFLTFEDRVASQEQNDFDMVVDLSHEVGHHVLHTYQTADSILESDLRAEVYSGVKQIPRPAIMSLHASAALAYMIAVTGRMARSTYFSARIRELALRRCEALIQQQRLALRDIRECVTPTVLGERIISEMEAQLTEVVR